MRSTTQIRMKALTREPPVFLQRGAHTPGQDRLMQAEVE